MFAVFRTRTKSQQTHNINHERSGSVYRSNGVYRGVETEGVKKFEKRWRVVSNTKVVRQISVGRRRSNTPHDRQSSPNFRKVVNINLNGFQLKIWKSSCMWKFSRIPFDDFCYSVFGCARDFQPGWTLNFGKFSRVSSANYDCFLLLLLFHSAT